MTQSKVAIVDYGVGNLLSVKRALEKCGAEVSIVTEAQQISKAGRLVLPGVGAFPKAIRRLRETNLVENLKNHANSERPLLAICLGMQLLMEVGTEFEIIDGLGIFDGSVLSINYSTDKLSVLKTPNIGWFSLQKPDHISNWNETLLKDTREGDAAYFVHSYMVSPKKQNQILAEISVGSCKIPAIISNGFITGCQFHPEKSGSVGLKIIRNFVS